MERALNDRPTASQQTLVEAQQRKKIGLLGITFFIASESMFFLGLFMAYFYVRNTSQAWPPEGVTPPSIVPAAFNTLIALIGSVAVIYAGRAIARDNRRHLVGGMVVAITCGVVFMAVQAAEFADLSIMAQGSAYGSTFTFLLVFHVLRVFCGVALMAAVLVRALMGQFSKDHRLMVQATEMYWVFITGVWLVVFYVLYIYK